MSNVINTSTSFANANVGSFWTISTSLTFDSKILNLSGGLGEVPYDFGVYALDSKNNALINVGVQLGGGPWTATFSGNTFTFKYYIASPLTTPGASYNVLIDGATINTASGFNSLVQVRTDIPFFSGSAAYFLNTFVSSAVAQSLGVSYSLNDTASALSQNLNVLNQFSSRISTVTVSDNAPITVAPNQINANLPILTKINSGGGSYVIQQPVSYSFSSANNLVHEGASINLFLNTTGLNNGASISYSISGIAADRLNSGSLFGTATVDSNGQARINLDIRANNRTDGPSTATVTIGNNLASTSVTINDTSLGAPSYTLTPSSSTINEGVINNITLQTTNLTAGSTVAYAISGIAANRLSTGVLSGTLTVDANGQAVIPVSVVNNNKVDGPTTAVITIGNNLATASVLINDTLTAPTNINPVVVTRNVPFNVNFSTQNIQGTELIDKVVIQMSASGFSLTNNGAQSFLKSLYAGEGRSLEDSMRDPGAVYLTNVERIKFSDVSVALDVGPTQNAGSVYMLYKAAFNRPSDTGGMGYWISLKDSGANITTNIAQGFVNSAEFIAKYGANPSNSSFVNNLYQNVLGRAGEAGGVAYWISEMDAGRVSKAQALVQFATLQEGAGIVAPLIANGIQYKEWVG